MLEEIVKATTLDVEKDTMKTAVLKGMAVGAVEGLIYVGAIHVLNNIFGSKKKQ